MFRKEISGAGQQQTLLEQELGSPPPWIMGVVNITPDSFSDGGCYLTPERALEHAYLLRDEGAHIIDIGAESTGPGAQAVAAADELQRLQPVVTALAHDVFLSVDTYKEEVARYCLDHGARMINDVSALRASPVMAETVARYDCFVVLMHSKESGKHPAASASPRHYRDVTGEISVFLEERVRFAVAQGIRPERIVVDPGMGRFLSDDPQISWELLKRIGEVGAALPGLPLLIGTSRKSFIGGELARRDPLSQLSALIACLKGARIIRTHNVKMAREFLEVWRRLMPDSGI